MSKRRRRIYDDMLSVGEGIAAVMVACIGVENEQVSLIIIGMVMLGLILIGRME